MDEKRHKVIEENLRRAAVLRELAQSIVDNASLLPPERWDDAFCGAVEAEVLADELEAKGFESRAPQRSRLA